MKFEELKRNLKTTIKNNYLLIGDDVFLLDTASDLIKQSLNIEIPDMNIIKFANESIDANDVLNALNTLPIFSDKKLVYMDLSNPNTKLINEKLFSKYFENVNLSSILVVKLGMVDTYLNDFKGNFELIDCSKLSPELAKKFMVNEFNKSEKEIQIKALDLLYEYTLGDLQKAKNEISKLVNFIGERKVIEEEDVETMVTKTPEFQIFELSQALAIKDGQKAFTILSTLEGKKDGARGVIGLIYNHFRRLLHISLSNLPKNELANLLGVKEFAITKSLPQCKSFSKKKLKQICDMCDELDFKVKTSAISPSIANEILLLFILKN